MNFNFDYPKEGNRKMRLSKAREVISGLSAPEQTRLRNFCRNLSTDKDPKHFDDNMEWVLEEVVKDERWYRDNINYLNGLGFNQSKYEYKQIEEQLLRFKAKHVPYAGWIDHFKVVKARMIEQVSSWKLRALDFNGNDDIQEWVPRDDAHAGWNYIETGMRNKGEYRENLLQFYNDNVDRAKKEGSFNCIMMPGTRTQATPPFNDVGDRTNDWKDKTRAVIMVAFEQVLAETLWAGPVQRRMANQDWYAGGKNDRVMMVFINRKMRRSKFWLTLDYSKYDQSIPGWLIFEAFDVIEAMFDKSYGFDEELWRIVKNDFVHKVFVDGHQGLIEAHDGVPSGSMFTQIMDTLVNVLMIKTYFESVGISETQYTMIIMGDDNLIYTTFKVNEEDLAGYIARNFGITINTSKSARGTTAQPPEFLSRVWTSRGVYRTPEVLLAKLLFPENFRKYDKSDKHKVRQQCYMIISCFIHDFPLGMKWVDENKIRLYTINEMSKAEHIKFTTGLMRYRLRTLGSKQYAA